MGDCLKKKIGVHPGHDIIENDGQSPMHATLDESSGRRFYYIQNTEKKESPDDRGECPGQEGHGDQISNDFVDDDSWTIFSGENDLGPP